MLNKTICEKCNDHYLNAVYRFDSEKEEVMMDFFKSLMNGRINCHWNHCVPSFSKELDIKTGEPPLECPYLLEQTVSCQNVK